MFISCVNCNKKFVVDESLIPEKGRLVICNSCNHQWFFKKAILNKQTTPIKIYKTKNDVDSINENSSENIKLLNKKFDEIPKVIVTSANNLEDKKNSIGKKIEVSKNNFSFKILSIIIIFIISFIALIVILDTFKIPIANIVPNIEFLLYNFYETIKDVFSFFKDLV